MLNIFFPSSIYPCNVGLYSPASGKNELEEKKINIARDESDKKNL
jgi:hypothetical protein